MAEGTKGSNRRLAAILHADVVGYSRLMSADEVGTVAALAACRHEVIEPTIEAHAGRIVNFVGDAVLAEFASVVNAVEAALTLQSRMDGRAAAVAPDARILLRVGVNLGDVIGDGSDIFGDGVNVAARIQALAEPGGIYVSGKVRDEVEGKLAAAFADEGLKLLKNIPAPVRVFRVAAADRRGAGTAPSPESSAASTSVPWAESALTIAVLPFTHMGGEPSEQYFGDGVTEDIITELARVPVLKVASRNAAFRFRGPDADIVAAARTLGVRFIVEGSVRRIGPRIRITAQLIDATSGAHVWAERYDRPVDDIFEVQDEVVRTIVGTLTGRVLAAGADIARRKPPASLAAYDLILRAEHSDWSTVENREEVRALAHRALAIDAALARGELLLGIMDFHDWLGDLAVSDLALEKALGHMRRAVALDSNDFYCHLGMGEVCLYSCAHDLAERHLMRALALNPNRPGVHLSLAHLSLYSGRPEEALQRLATARHLDPYHEPRWLMSSTLMMHYVAGQYTEAVEVFRGIDTPREWVNAYGAAAYAMLGNDLAAAECAADALRAWPAFTISASLSRDPFKRPEDRQHVADGMRKAGLPR